MRAPRNWSVAVLVGLVVVAVVATVLALRPASPPAAPPLLASTAVVATAGDQVWVWYGVAACRGGSSSTPTATTSIAHYDGRSWQVAQTPLASVTALTFSGPRRGVATGPLVDCTPATLTTTDGGTTWQPVADGSPADGSEGATATGSTTAADGSTASAAASASTGASPSVSASLTGATLWTVAGAGRHRVSRALMTPSGGLSSQQMTQPTDPCQEPGSPTSSVAAVSPTTALLLCQNVDADERHVLRTTSAGLAWEVLVDQRPQTGFDGSGVSVVGLSAVGRELAWALFADPQGECPEGQVRRSDDGGLTWTRLTCPNQSAPVDRVLAMDFGSTTRGVLVGMTGNHPTVLVSTDGGQVWQALSAPLPTL